MEHLRNKNILEAAKDYWVILVFFFGLAVTWGTMLTKIGNIEVRIDKVEQQGSLSATSIQSIRESQARVETRLEFLLDKR